MSKSVDAKSQFYTTLGLMTAVWAQVEFMVDVMMGTLCISSHDPSLHRTVPWSFNRKIQFIKRALGSMKILSPHRSKGNALMVLSLKLSKDRNFLSHAAGVSSMDEVFSRQMMAFLPGLTGIQKQDVSIEEVVEFTGRLVDLAHDLLDFYADAFVQLLPFAVPLSLRSGSVLRQNLRTTRQTAPTSIASRPRREPKDRGEE